MRAVRAADSRTPSAARDPKRTRPSVNSAARRKKASDAGGGGRGRPLVSEEAAGLGRSRGGAVPVPALEVVDALGFALGRAGELLERVPLAPGPRAAAVGVAHPRRGEERLRFAPESAGGRILPSSAAFPRRRRRSSLSLGSPGPPWYPAPPVASGSPRLLTRRMAMATTPRTPTTLMGASMNEEMGRSSRRLSSIACCTASSVVSNSFSASACASASSASFAAASSAARASREARARLELRRGLRRRTLQGFLLRRGDRIAKVFRFRGGSRVFLRRGLLRGRRRRGLFRLGGGLFEDVFFEDAEDFAVEEDSDFVAATAVTSAASLDALASPTAPMSAGAATI